MRLTLLLSSDSCVSSGEAPSDSMSLARANSERLRAPDEAACRVWYSSCVRRKISMRFLGLCTAIRRPVEVLERFWKLPWRGPRVLSGAAKPQEEPLHRYLCTRNHLIQRRTEYERTFSRDEPQNAHPCESTRGKA